jgi:hypothetical protein
MAYEDTIIGQQAARHQKEIAGLRETINFFQCVIKSGERWSSVCQQRFEAAWANPGNMFEQDLAAERKRSTELAQENIRLGKQYIEERQQHGQAMADRERYRHLWELSTKKMQDLRARTADYVRQSDAKVNRVSQAAREICDENRLLREDNHEMSRQVLAALAQVEEADARLALIKRPWHWSNALFSFAFTIGIILVWKLLFG